jgi:MOB kinase activator 1
MDRIKDLFGNSNKQTFKPKKKFSKDTKRYSLHKHAKNTLGTDIHQMAKSCLCPDNEDINEWYAVACIDFYNKINLLYGAVQSECNVLRNPRDKIMCAGPKYEYLWIDEKSEKYKKPTQVSAPMYITLAMDWIEGVIKAFPVSEDESFPKHFKNNVVKHIFKRIFRIFAHIFYEHYNVVDQLGIAAHMSTTFKHFMVSVTIMSLYSLFLIIELLLDIYIYT